MRYAKGKFGYYLVPTLSDHIAVWGEEIVKVLIFVLGAAIVIFTVAAFQ